MMARLEQDANRLTAWFPENYMISNEDKCHLFSGLVKKELFAKIIIIINNNNNK